MSEFQCALRDCSYDDMLGKFYQMATGGEWAKCAPPLTKRQGSRARLAYGHMLSAAPTPAAEREVGR